MREKPPRGGRRGELEEEPVFGSIPERKQGVKPERRLSGGVFEGSQGRSGTSQMIIIGSDPGYCRGYPRTGGAGRFTERIFMRHRGSARWIGTIRGGVDGNAEARERRTGKFVHRKCPRCGWKFRRRRNRERGAKRGTTAVAIITATIIITITITNRDGVIDDPVGGAEVEDEAAAAIVGTRSVDGMACRSGWRREERPRRDDAALSADGLTGISSPVFRSRSPGRRGWR